MTVVKIVAQGFNVDSGIGEAVVVSQVPELGTGFLILGALALLDTSRRWFVCCAR